MANVTAMDVANFFIDLCSVEEDGEITNMKVNKLLYYAQGFSLVLLGKPLFPEPIEAWEHGPVVRTVYKAFQPCGKNNIMAPYGDYDEEVFDAEQLRLLMDVFMEYSRYSAAGLRNMTHQAGTPWSRVYVPRENQVISNEDMAQYFEQQHLNRADLHDCLAKTPTVGRRDEAGHYVLPEDWR